MNYVFLGDSPTIDSGFGNVTRNIVSRLSFKQDVAFWGIAYDGTPHDFPFSIFPANPKGGWNNHENLTRLVDFIMKQDGPTTLWTLHDAYRFQNLVPALDYIREHKEFFVIAYSPVDSPLTVEDEAWFRRVDFPVAYTKYGKKQIQRFRRDVLDIPHGVEDCFVQKMVDRREYFPEVGPNDILIANVNSNSPRKAPYRTLETFKFLHDKNPAYKFYMHMDPREGNSCDLKKLARSLGIPVGTIFFAPNNWEFSKETLVDLYNCFNMVASTSLGEGWGLTTCEAAQCGVPVAVPNNSSFTEIFHDEGLAVELPPSGSTILYDNKLLPDVDAKGSAEAIHRAFQDPLALANRADAAQRKMVSYNWDSIVKQWEEVFHEV